MRTLLIPGQESYLLDVVVPEGVEDYGDVDDVTVDVNSDDLPALIALD